MNHNNKNQTVGGVIAVFIIIVSVNGSHVGSRAAGYQRIDTEGYADRRGIDIAILSVHEKQITDFYNAHKEHGTVQQDSPLGVDHAGCTAVGR